ncbi:ABC transporter ATP-binding protein [Streptomyces cocklensis]|uniref:Peptide/nickel transport system ATP-binding protein n=1 Tax=Actinacidiphila cocklensis TaxID=887465 RepID=A0A9W4GST3_9ACTN|nr:ABC transporter ATP-binding protein [Actinacidiphila cocklensis]MDD1061231.1 ABC transporter ATP-binding protein [Actinacidiphila cocklensis]WSX76927.1 ABC transporter ATP-binding protein [Streptomyces sp. NBC_00899]CAG6395782.1 Peptide/nickel transport system ATP-binding protein [Actinacidiphila cocklensis]
MNGRPGDPVLDIRGLHVDFAGVPAVRGVDLALHRGEVLGLVGESGSGKSVTALAAMGLLPGGAGVRGSVRLDGTELVGAGDAALSAVRGNRIAMVFQDPLSAFTPVYRIGDQIVEALRTHQDLSRERAAERAVELLDLVGIPEPRVRAAAFPHEFSGGMRQRAMIAMAMANDPDVILADEPTTALDVTVQAQVLDVLRTAQRETGAALLLVSHDLGVIAGTADRVAVMYAGRIVETAPVDALFARPRMPYTLGLIGAVPRLDADAEGRPEPLVPIPGAPPAPAALPPGCAFAPRCPLAEDRCRTAEPELAAAAGEPHLAACVRAGEVSGLRPLDVFPVPAADSPARGAAGGRPDGGSVLRVSGLARTFPLLKGAVFRRRVGSVHAVDGVDLDIRAGEVLGLVGESGSGKSTTLFEILELRPPERGSVEVLGRGTDALTRREAHALRAQVQIVFQDPMASLDPRLPVGDAIAEPLRAQRADRDRIARRVPELMRQVGLDPAHGDRFPHEFSGGQRQRVGIARALAVDPRLLVLDEPVSALDVSVQAGVLNLLLRLRAELGLAYLFVSHDLSVVRHIADRVSVMYLGRTVEAGAVGEVFARPLHPYTQALLSAVPLPDPVRERARARILLPGDPPSPTRRLSGCPFRSRCQVFAALPEPRRERCTTEAPALAEQGGDHVAACHFPAARAVV